ncbi:hypothetical protein XH87_25905 [Bradyrhizobium sp. CCBAU 53415]|nr:hypothetical protein [Bradyrhizobium sp. CCBAU 53415]
MRAAPAGGRRGRDLLASESERGGVPTDHFGDLQCTANGSYLALGPPVGGRIIMDRVERCFAIMVVTGVLVLLGGLAALSMIGPAQPAALRDLTLISDPA